MEFQQHWTPPSKYQRAFKHYCPATAATRCHKEKLCRVSRDAFEFDVVTSVTSVSTSVSSVISITLVTSVAPCVSVNQAVLARRANRPASLASWQSQFKQCTSQLGFLSFPNRFTWDRVGPCGNLAIHGTLLQRAPSANKQRVGKLSLASKRICYIKQLLSSPSAALASIFFSGLLGLCNLKAACLRLLVKQSAAICQSEGLFHEVSAHCQVPPPPASHHFDGGSSKSCGIPRAVTIK